MTRELILRRVGGSIGATLPKDMADRLQWPRRPCVGRGDGGRNPAYAL